MLWMLVYVLAGGWVVAWAWDGCGVHGVRWESRRAGGSNGGWSADPSTSLGLPALGGPGGRGTYSGIEANVVGGIVVLWVKGLC